MEYGPGFLLVGKVRRVEVCSIVPDLITELQTHCAAVKRIRTDSFKLYISRDFGVLSHEVEYLARQFLDLIVGVQFIKQLLESSQ